MKNYQYIIRIDEDCKLLHIPTNIIETYNNNNIVFSSGFYQGEDDANVTIGLNNLFNYFINKNNIKVSVWFTHVSLYYEHAITSKFSVGVKFTTRWYRFNGNVANLYEVYTG